ILTEIATADDGLYVLAQTDGIGRLFFLGDGSTSAEVELPIRGNALRLEGGRRGVTFALQDWFTASRWYRARGTEVSALGVNSASYEGMASARQLRESATSADGTKVPLAILLPPGHRPGPAPLLL